MEHAFYRESDERKRIEILESVDIMDTPRELSFDQLAFLASKVCGAPIALISFINSHRQWFKASYGLEIHEIPKYVSACNQTLIERERFEIPDASVPNSPYHDFMEEQGYRFYAGVPISSSDRLSMGALCVLDYVPRKLSEEQFKALEVIASQISDLLEIRRKYKENLNRLREIGEVSYRNDKFVQEIAHRSKLHSIAELAAGLSYRIKPLALGVLGIAEKLPEESEGRVVLTNSSKEILNVFNSLERFIRAESEKSMRPFDVRTALETIINHLSYRIREEKVDFHLTISDPEIICIGNESQLKEVFHAVLFNALDAVEHQGEKKIDVIVREVDHKVFIEVEDNGQGVSEMIEPFIFQPFYTTKGSNSLGIGLSLAQSLMQRHSGDIKLDRNYAPTRFTISIPKP